MQIHNLKQGSPEWHAYRANHYNASDAPAMLGHSPYKTREQLLKEYATGVTAEVDAGTQRRFDDGHRFERLAGALAEQILGEELFPMVGSEGRYSASFDGLTDGYDIAFEHKSLNNDLRAVMVPGATGAALPIAYRIQMEQQAMVSGCARILFVASKWANDDTLIEERHVWYTPDPQLRAQIVAGWEQFDRDRAAYVAPAAPVVEAVGREPEMLPALRIEVTGMVTSSNLVEFKAHAFRVFKGINRKLTTGQHFADAEKAIKWCANVEDAGKAAKRHALSQTQSIDEMFRVLDEVVGEARNVRLELDKLVKSEKEAFRTRIVQEGMAALAEHVEGLNKRLGRAYMPPQQADFNGAIKGLRTPESLQEAVNTTLAQAKIAASQIADRMQLNLNSLRDLASDHKFLFSDVGQLLGKDNADLVLVIKSRIAEHQQAEERRLESDRARIRQEEAARLEREQAEKRAADERQAEDERQAAARQQLLEDEAKAKAAAQQAQQSGALPAPLAQAVSDVASHVRAEGVAAIDADRVIATAQRAAAAPLPAPVANEPATLLIGAINARLGFTVSGAFLSSLGFEPARVDGPRRLYRDSDFRRIAQAIAAHTLKAADLLPA